MRKQLICASVLSLAVAACGSEAGAPDGAPPPPVDAGLFPHDEPIVDGSAEGVVDDLGESLWFSLTSPGSEWIVVELTFPAGFMSYHRVRVDLYDASGTQVVGQLGGDLDTSSPLPRIIAYVSEAGDYYLNVSDMSSSPGPDPFAPLSFTISVRPPTAPKEHVDPEAGDAAADALDITPANPGPFGWTTFLLGLEEHAEDADPFTFDVSDGNHLIAMNMQGEPRQMSLLQPDGTVYARIDFAAYPDGRLDPPAPLATGSWLVDIDGPTAAPGTPYVAALAVTAEFEPSGTQPEVEDPAAPGANDDLVGAESLTMYALADDTGEATGQVAQPIGRLSAPADVDVYSFTVGPSSQVLLQCAAGLYGSGARSLSVELLDAGGGVLATFDEVDGAAARPWAPLVDGDYAIRVHKLAQDPVVVSDYYKCVVAMMPE